MLIGDNISAQPPQSAAEPGQASAPEATLSAAAEAGLAAPEHADTAGAHLRAGSPPSSSNGFGSFIRSRNVIGRVAEKLHLGSRSNSGGGFGSGSRPSLYLPPDAETQPQLQQQQAHPGSNLKPQPELASAADQRQAQAAQIGQPGAPGGRRTDQQVLRGTSQVLTTLPCTAMADKSGKPHHAQPDDADADDVFHNGLQAPSKSSASSSRMPTLDGGTTSSNASDSVMSDAHRFAFRRLVFTVTS